MEDSDIKKIGPIIRGLRLGQGLTASELARKSEVSESDILKIERMDRFPTVVTVSKILNALDVSIEIRPNQTIGAI